ncbi:uncharacterized protein C8A04DRAFT_30681 [Dichotomopilus funicola]|uniref:Uncharacterized protein n=1 Tax=Dichotomopilus funicola TaxID=1934379 RepID=A0AAN6UZF0_9PEZI|nr:hypothetical protein C8A04DRAFT_30681 [Dichotomopilus funicola]
MIHGLGFGARSTPVSLATSWMDTRHSGTLYSAVFLVQQIGMLIGEPLIQTLLGASIRFHDPWRGLPFLSVGEFIGVLEDFLGVKRTPFSFAEEWKKNPPKKAGGVPLLKYTEKSAFWALCYDYYHGFDDFRAEYRAKFGKDAFVSSVVRFRWGIGKEVTPEEYETYLEELAVFRDWVSDLVLGPDSDTLSNAILIMPYGEAGPEYRDDPSPPAGTFPTIAEKFISPIIHAPQLVLPWSDLMLIELARAALNKASWPTSIQTGRYMYPLGDDSRNVGSPNDKAGISYETRRKGLQEIHDGFEHSGETSSVRIELCLAE